VFVLFGLFFFWKKYNNEQFSVGTKANEQLTNEKRETWTVLSAF